MTDQPAIAAASPARLTGLILAAAGAASFVLLANHPDGAAKDFAGVLAGEAANRTMDAIVHGGFIVLLGVQMVCYAAFSARRAGFAGLVLFAMGTAFLCGSLVTDGLVIPAIAAKYLPMPAKLEYARSLFVLCGSFIAVLMPMGLAFQSAGVAAWGVGLLRTGSRVAGAAGLLIGGGLLAALVLQPMNPFAAMAGIVGLAVWAIVAGVAMLSGRA
ncbi:MAG TPA: hypothetical protein VGG48_17515 [Rhizomicrobium sp.]|jgi:hypothetical protein